MQQLALSSVICGPVVFPGGLGGFSACFIQRFVGYLWNLNVFKFDTPSWALTRAAQPFTGANKRAVAYIEPSTAVDR